VLPWKPYGNTWKQLSQILCFHRLTVYEEKQRCNNILETL
jgi:hypothetical protein